MKRLLLIATHAVALALTPLTAAAELIHQEPNGFTVSHSITTDKELMTLWRTMTAHVDQWWSSDHSWSGDASNMSIDVKAGGCFCEKLPNGGEVEHLRIIHYNPGVELRFDGALGPLQSMAVTGRMIWKIDALEQGYRVSFTYHVFGHPAGGLDGIAAAVDQVIGEQLAGLENRLGWD